MNRQTIPIITSPRNHRIVAARKLDQRKHRQRRGRFLVEGLQLLHIALDADARPIEVFYCPDLFAGTQATALLDSYAQVHPLPAGQPVHLDLFMAARHVSEMLWAADLAQVNPSFRQGLGRWLEWAARHVKRYLDK